MSFVMRKCMYVLIHVARVVVSSTPCVPSPHSSFGAATSSQYYLWTLSPSTTSSLPLQQQQQTASPFITSFSNHALHLPYRSGPTKSSFVEHGLSNHASQPSTANLVRFAKNKSGGVRFAVCCDGGIKICHADSARKFIVSCL